MRVRDKRLSVALERKSAMPERLVSLDVGGTS